MLNAHTKNLVSQWLQLVVLISPKNFSEFPLMMTLASRFNLTSLRRSACLLSMALVTLSGCSSVSEMLEPEKIDYKSVGKTSSNAGTKLEVPPDLTQAKGDSRYAVGENSKGTATASSFNEQRKTPGTKPVEGKVAPSSDPLAGMPASGSEDGATLPSTGLVPGVLRCSLNDDAVAVPFEFSPTA